MKVFPAAGYAAVQTGVTAPSSSPPRTTRLPTSTPTTAPSACTRADGRSSWTRGTQAMSTRARAFDYGTSPAAHATICVDGFDWAKGAPARTARGSSPRPKADGLYTLLTRNPNAAQGGGGGRRILVYAPARFLLVIDEVDASADQRLSRHIPLAPELEATLAPEQRNVAKYPRGAHDRRNGAGTDAGVRRRTALRSPAAGKGPNSGGSASSSPTRSIRARAAT